MTEVVTPPPASERACPRCGASLAPDQEWCLSCGTAAGTRVAGPPAWRVPVAILGIALALLAAALVLALVELSGDPQPVAKSTPAPAPTPAQSTPAPTVTAEPGATAPEPGATPTPGETPSAGESEPGLPPASGEDGTGTLPGVTTGGGTSGGAVASWPAGKSGWTVIVASTRTRSDAERKAKRQSGAGVLESGDFASLRKGYWVVFSGQYETREQASAAAEGVGNDAYARRIVPR